MRLGRFSFNDIFRIWRLAIAIVLFEIIGGVLGVTVDYYHSWFMNMWIGGALGLLPGFLVGLAWHHLAAPDRARSVYAVWFVGGIGAYIFLAAIFDAIPRMNEEMRRIADVSQLDTSEITQIEVFDKDGDTLLLSMTDPAVIAEFARSASDAKGYSPNHELYDRSWYLVVSGRTKREYELNVDSKYPEAVIGGFVSKTDNNTCHFGSFISQNLREWVDRNLI